MKTNPNLESMVIRPAVAGDREMFCQLVHAYYEEDHGVELHENFSRTTFQTLLHNTTKGQIVIYNQAALRLHQALRFQQDENVHLLKAY